MEQHPVPQNISSYEFRLVGDMTLKQFFQLGAGVVAALVFYRSPLPFLLKWPLVGASLGTGIMLAFIPLAGRPFSQWLVAFFKAVYSPTQFTWSATSDTPSQPESPAQPAAPTAPPPSPLDKLESQLISRISQIFSQPTPPSPGPAGSPLRYSPTVSYRLEAAAPITGPTRSVVKPVAVSAPPGAQTGFLKIVSDQRASQPPPPPPVGAAPPPPTGPVTPPLAASAPVRYSTLTPIIRRGPGRPPKKPVAAAPTTVTLTPPTQPNILTGMVVTAPGQLLEGAIIEIVDSASGIPVRAMRTNRLGQFFTATPLPKGSYTVNTEKEGFIFDPVSVRVSGGIITPIIIGARENA